MGKGQLIIEGKVYISSATAAKLFGYAQDYIGELVRDGKIEATKVGRSWFINESSISLHVKENSGAPSFRTGYRRGGKKMAKSNSAGTLSAVSASDKSETSNKTGISQNLIGNFNGSQSVSGAVAAYRPFVYEVETPVELPSVSSVSGAEKNTVPYVIRPGESRFGQVPVKTGIQRIGDWIPTSAGMTEKVKNAAKSFSSSAAKNSKIFFGNEKAVAFTLALVLIFGGYTFRNVLAAELGTVGRTAASAVAAFSKAGGQFAVSSVNFVRGYTRDVLASANLVPEISKEKATAPTASKNIAKIFPLRFSAFFQLGQNLSSRSEIFNPTQTRIFADGTRINADTDADKRRSEITSVISDNLRASASSEMMLPFVAFQGDRSVEKYVLKNEARNFSQALRSEFAKSVDATGAELRSELFIAGSFGKDFATAFVKNFNDGLRLAAVLGKGGIFAVVNFPNDLSNAANSAVATLSSAPITKDTFASALSVAVSPAQTVAKSVNENIDALIFGISDKMITVQKNLARSVGSYFSRLFGGSRFVYAPTISKNDQTNSANGAPSSAPASAPATRPSSAPAKVIVQTPQNIVQRVTESVNYSGVSRDEFEARLNQLAQNIFGQLAGLSGATSANTSYINNVYNNVTAPMNRIDKLPGADITDSTFTGGSISGASISGGTISGASIDGSQIFGALSVATTTIAGPLTITGSTTMTSLTVNNAAGTSTITGDVAFDSDTLVVDSVNNRVGIGTTSPSETFSLNGAALFAQIPSPAITSDRLYNVGGDLYFAGNLIGSASIGTWTALSGNVYRPTGNVGIGTTSPYARFSVEHLSTTGTVIGTDALAGFTGNLLDLKVASTSKFTIDQDGNITSGTLSSGSFATNMLITSNASGSLVSSSTPTAANYLATSTTATSTFAGGLSVAGTSGLTVLQNGNVGVGTAGPGAKLHVNGGDIWVINNGSSPALILGDVATAGNYGSISWNSPNDYLAISGTASGAPSMVVAESHNVGIGTTAPLAKLHVGNYSRNDSVDSQILISRLVDATIASNGHAFSDSSSINRFGYAYNSFDAKAYFYGTGNFDHYVGFQVQGNIGQTGTMTNLYGLYTTQNISAAGAIVSNNYGIKIVDPTGSGSVVNNYGLYIDNVAKGSTSNYAIYSAGGTNYFSGNVGIGTTSPWAQLSVNPNGISGPAFAIGSSTATTFVVTNGGNVGIGTTAPGKLLHLSSANPYLKIGDTTGNSTSPTVQFSAGSSSYGWKIAHNSAVSGLDFTRTTATGGESFGTPTMVILNTGNIGVGTAEPEGKLHVFTGSAGTVSPQQQADDFVIESSGATGMTLFAPNNQNSRIAFGSPTDDIGALVGWNHDADLFEITTANTGADLALRTGLGVDAIRILDSGNVGIGTTTPYAKLSVENTAGGGATPLFVVASSTNGAATSTAFYISPTGNVGVGTGNPGEKLQVAGSIGATGSNGSINTNGVYLYDSGAAGNIAAFNTGANPRPLNIDGQTLNFLTGSATYALRMKVDTTGNVGIGTTSPSAKLAIDQGSATTIGQYIAGFWNATADLFRVSTSTPTATSTAFVIDSNGKVGIGTSTPSGTNSLAVQGQSYFAGNVGIGTTTPSAALSVAGDALIGVGPGSVLNWNAGTANWFQKATTTIQSGQNYAWSIATSTSALAILTIDTSGNGAMATTTFNSGFTVDGGAFNYDYYSGITSIDNLTVGGSTFDSDAGTITWTDLPISSAAALGTVESYTARIGGSPVLTVFGISNGDTLANYLSVGIATDTPSALLALQGTTSQTALYISGVAGGAGAAFPLVSISTSSAVMAATSTAFIIDQNGKVGIGTSTPFAMLAVQGTVAMNGLTAISGTPNYLCLSPGGEVMVGNSSNCTPSSERFKHDIATTTEGLSTILNVRPVSFVYNEGDQSPRLGFIAEEVQKIDPRLVVFGNDGLPASVRYESFSAVLTEGMQQLAEVLGVEQTGTMQIGTTTIATFGSLRLDSIENRLSALESRMGSTTGSGATENASGTSAFSVASVTSAVSSWLSSLGVSLSSAVADFTNLVARRLTVGSDSAPTGITLFDKTTGAPYCFSIAGGEATTTPGACSAAPAADSSADTTASSSDPSVIPADAGIQSGSSASSTSPVISVNGANPAEVSFGTAYADLGAVITDTPNQNLGIRAIVDGRDVGDQSNIFIDTTVSSVSTSSPQATSPQTAVSHTIEYYAVNQAGERGSAIRTVNVVPIAPPVVNPSIPPASTTPPSPDISSSTPATSTPSSI